MTYLPSNQKYIFSTPGTFFWTCPVNVKYVDISGGCGVSGSLTTLKYVPVTPGVSYSVTVGNYGTTGSAGSGGNGGSSLIAGTSGGTGGVGGAGGNSIFTFPNGMRLFALGGAAGLGGNGGGFGTGSAAGAGGTSQNTYTYTSFNFQPSYPASPIGSDGSQAGTTGGVGLVTATGSQINEFFIYRIYTDVADSVTAYPATYQYYGPFGRPGILSLLVSGNTIIDTSVPLTGSVIGASSRLGSFGGGAGGIMALINPIPLYMIGIDFNTITSGNKLILPFINSNSSNGLGNGGDSSGGSGATPTSAVSPSNVGVAMWSDANATVLGYGAGGIGGPGGGGGSHGGFTGGAGGSGYHGDQGLPGAVIISVA
jgi:hypothetical protein